MMRSIALASVLYPQVSGSSLGTVQGAMEHPFGTLETDQHGDPRVVSRFYWTNTQNFDFVPGWVLGGDSKELVKVTLKPADDLVGRYFYDIEGYSDLVISYYVSFFAADLVDMERAYALNLDGDTNAPVAVYSSAVSTGRKAIGHGAYTIWRKRSADSCGRLDCVPVWRLMQGYYYTTSFRQKATLMKKFIEWHHRYFVTDKLRHEDFRRFTMVNVHTMEVHPPHYGYSRRGSLSDVAISLLVCFIQGNSWSYWTNSDPYNDLMETGRFENRDLVDRALFRGGNPVPVIHPGEIRGLPETVTFRKFNEVFLAGDEYFGISIELWNAALNTYIQLIEQVDVGATDLIPSLADILDSLIHGPAA